ncbi:hypothetical protein CKAH01_07388 [Colletotrichum kahawae]|uniref:Uncharacterized protein n=1 Tax=Colletotrichum kahawae TaxID=34407 RepID=A0AAE0D227_COLKA|nr:hypothetical protein CKAH01_07388 [Colletotrichum kahawae]
MDLIQKSVSSADNHSGPNTQSPVGQTIHLTEPPAPDNNRTPSVHPTHSLTAKPAGSPLPLPWSPTSNRRPGYTYYTYATRGGVVTTWDRLHGVARARIGRVAQACVPLACLIGRDAVLTCRLPRNSELMNASHVFLLLLLLVPFISPAWAVRSRE